MRKHDNSNDVAKQVQFPLLPKCYNMNRQPDFLFLYILESLESSLVYRGFLKKTIIR